MDALTVHAVAQMAEARRYTAFAADLYRLAAEHAITPQGAQVLREKADGLTHRRHQYLDLFTRAAEKLTIRPDWWKVS